MPTRVKKLPNVVGPGRYANNPETYQRIKVLLSGNPYRFAAGVDYDQDQLQEFANCIYYLGRSHGFKASIRTAKDRKSVTAQFFKRPHRRTNDE